LKPAVTVIVPAYNSSATLEACISSIQDQLSADDRLMVVDDGSTDATAGQARSLGAEVISTGGRKGPAAARNLGAEAADTPVLLFLDSDVVVPEGLLEEVRSEFTGGGEVQAVQTLYTPVCPAEDPVSRYQNLYYHFALARIDPEDSAVTATWCTAIGRNVFEELGGFDDRIPEPTVEDEELGYAIADRGGRIVLRKDLQVTHLASYTTGDFVRRRLRMARAQAKSGWRSVSDRLLKRYVNIRETGTHHSRRVVLSILLTLAAAALLPAGLLALLLDGPWLSLLACSLLLVPAALACHLSFFALARRLMGPRVLPAFAGLCLLDMLVLGLGVAHGTVQFLAGRRF
jgi:glycosyltransferase involved in cell wall biosynthesis